MSFSSDIIIDKIFDFTREGNTNELKDFLLSEQFISANHANDVINTRNEFANVSALYYAAIRDDTDTIELLLNQTNIDIDLKDEYEETALIKASRIGLLLFFTIFALFFFPFLP